MEGTELYERVMRRLFMAVGARSHEVRFGAAADHVHVLDVPGSGVLPPVALLHGFSASGPSQYGGMARHLRRHVRRLVIPDLPGHGSSSNPSRLDGATMQAGLFASLDAMVHPDQPVVIFASSMSGGLAVRYAAENPSRVAALVLCSPGGAPPTERELATLLDTFRIESHRDALRFVDALFPRKNWLRQAYAWGVRQQFRRPTMRQLLDRIGDERFLDPDELASLEMPVHLIWGQADRILPERHLAFFRSHLPSHATVETPSHFGHAPFLHHADELSLTVLRVAREAQRTRRHPARRAVAA